MILKNVITWLMVTLGYGLLFHRGGWRELLPIALITGGYYVLDSSKE
jgi:hypothetical protein